MHLEQDRELSGEIRTGAFKLQHQKRGIGYFGQVRVELRTASGDEEPGTVRWAVDPADRTSIQLRSDAEFVRAAERGVADGLVAAADAGADTTGLVADVVHVQVNLIDIEESAVAAAAGMAVAIAAGVEGRVELTFDEGWQVRPTRTSETV